MEIKKFETNENTNIQKTIAVVSGKGGVGKSFTTSLLASSLNRKGYKVGILDADITGPSIPKSFGIKEKAYSDGVNISPLESKNGIKLMSVNLILEDEESPVLWRGPIVNGAIRDFYEKVDWGDLDYLLIDMPPGTSDVSLTIFQSIKIDGLVIVTTPQELVSMIVKKSLNMARMMNMNIAGIVENMSYYECPNCKEKINIFGESSVYEEAKKFKIDNVLKLPINSDFAKIVDKGNVEEIEIEDVYDFISKLG